MRLTNILFKWPKKRPHGNIWIGKDRMVAQVQPWMKSRIQKNVENEKKNMFYCVNPAVSIQAEDAYFKYMNENGERPNEAWWKLRKNQVEKQVDFKKKRGWSPAGSYPSSLVGGPSLATHNYAPDHPQKQRVMFEI